jgi:hypothetical protein
LKSARILLEIEIASVCLSLLLSCITFADYDMIGPKQLIVAVSMAVALISGILSFKLLSKRLKIACGILLLYPVLLLPQQIWWCWNNAMHPPHYKERQSMDNAADRAEENKDFAGAERIYKNILEKEKVGYFRGHSWTELRLASALEEEKKYKEAEQVYLSTLKRVKPDDHERITDYPSLCSLNLAILYVKDKRYAESTALLKELMLRHREHGTQSWESVLRVDDYLKCLRAKGLSDEAEALEREIHTIGIEIAGGSGSRK